MNAEVLKVGRGAYSVLTNSREELYEQCGIISRKAPTTLDPNLYTDIITWNHFDGDDTLTRITCDKFPLKQCIKYIDAVDDLNSHYRREIGDHVGTALTTWERDFISSMRIKTLGDMGKNWITRKQYNTLSRIYGRVQRHDSAAAGLRRLGRPK